MKKISRICVCLLATCLTAIGVASCVDDDFASKTGVVEGQPIRVSMNFSFNPGKEVVVTRADDFAELTNLMLFIYSETGEFQKVVSTADASLSFNGTSETVSGGVRRQIQFETTSGTKKLLAVANNGGSWWEDLSGLATQAATLSFDEMKTAIIDLQSTADMQPITITGSSQMLMTGWNEGVEFATNGTISDYGEHGVPDLQVAIKLDRSFAHITFNIVAEPADAKGTFTPTSYRVYNVPVNSYLTNTAKLPVPGDNAFEFIDYAQANVGSLNAGNYSFDFYMPENTYAQVEGVSEYKDRDKWSNGQEDKNTLPKDKNWSYAPKTSTFVVISGSYTGSGANGQGNYTGNVTYTVHLGDFSDNGGGSMGNFSVERNCSYTYNMRVLGVDKIIVEAEKTGEEADYQQGAEGNIFDYSDCKYTYSLDAHYEQVYLEYNLSQIANALPDGLNDEKLDNAIANQLILVIQSEAMDYNHQGTDDTYTVQNKRGTLKPYRIYRNAMREGGGESAAAAAKQEVLEGEGAGIKPTKGFDYRWVEFWPQSEANQIAIYPGVSEWSKENLTDMDNPNVYGGDAHGENEHLLDVYDVIVAMGNVIKKIYSDEAIDTQDYNEDGIIVTNNGGNYYARFTAFVNENYYYKHPLTHADIDTWNVMTNKIPREMIIAMSTDVSTDGNSSYSKLYSYISQLSMQTFYNSRAESVNAFGIESYNETPSTFSWGTPRSARGLDDTDGRGNQMTLIDVSSYRNPNWSSFIGYGGGNLSSYSYSHNGWLSGTPADHKLGANAYAIRSAYAACMSRNRDLNGDGEIQPNEVRWYLPSLNEYIRMSIGTSAVSNVARLYSGDKSKMTRNGYPDRDIQFGSLYYTSSEDSKRVYWAVERGSYGAINVYYDGSALPIRCVRLLPGIGNRQDLTTMDVQSDPTYRSYKVGKMHVLDFRNILDGSLYRGRVNDLEIHNEDEAENRFYDGIFVARQYLDETYKLGDIVGADGTYSWQNGSITFDGTKDNPCSGYHEGEYTNWRVPNLVELSAMNAAGFLNDNTDSQITICCTQFSNMDVRYGFGRSTLIYCPGGNGDIDMSYNFRIRCVRDVPPGFFNQ